MTYVHFENSNTKCGDNFKLNNSLWSNVSCLSKVLLTRLKPEQNHVLKFYSFYFNFTLFAGKLSPLLIIELIYIFFNLLLINQFNFAQILYIIILFMVYGD